MPPRSAEPGCNTLTNGSVMIWAINSWSTAGSAGRKATTTSSGNPSNRGMR